MGEPIVFIEKIAIESFGSLSSVTYELTEGINIIRGNNECGKSTLAAFIKFIFYGLSGTLPDGSMTEESRYISWKSGIAGGHLVILHKGKRYRIDRRITPATRSVGRDSVAVTDLDSGKEVFDGKCPGEVFFGVSEEVFAQTAFSAQGSGSVVDAEKMNSAIDNILFSGNESVSVRGALDTLSAARGVLLADDRASGKIYTVDRELEDLEARLAKAEENEAFLEAKTHSLEEGNRQLEETKRLLGETEDKLTQYEAITVLARFSDLDEKKEAYRLALAEAERVKNAHTVKDFFPDHAYCDEIRSLHADVSLAENELASLKAQKDAFAVTSLSPEQHTVLRAVEACGGREKAEEALSTLTAKRKNRIKIFLALLALAFVAGVLSLLFGAVGIVPSLLAPPFILYALYGITAILAVITVSVGVSLTRLKTKALYETFCARDEAEALRMIRLADEADRAVREEDLRYGEIAEKLDTCRLKLVTLTEKAKTLLSKWGLACEGRPSLLTAAEQASLAILALEEAAFAVKKAKVAYESAESALVGFSREEYEEKKRRTAYVGAVSSTSLDDLKRKFSFYSKKQDALEKQLHATEIEIASRSAVTENSQTLREALAEAEEKRKDYVDRYKAFVLAHEAIRKSSQRLRERISPALSESASALMKASTKGRYADLGIDTALSLSFRTDTASPSRSIGYLSAGTKALAYISLRLALIRLLFCDNMPPTVFDEAFSWLDSERLAAVMSLLTAYSSTSQVILLTCCDREYEASADKNAIHLIRL